MVLAERLLFRHIFYNPFVFSQYILYMLPHINKAANFYKNK